MHCNIIITNYGCSDCDGITEHAPILQTKSRSYTLHSETIHDIGQKTCHVPSGGIGHGILHDDKIVCYSGDSDNVSVNIGLPGLLPTELDPGPSYSVQR